MLRDEARLRPYRLCALPDALSQSPNQSGSAAMIASHAGASAVREWSNAHQRSASLHDAGTS